MDPLVVVMFVVVGETLAGILPPGLDTPSVINQECLRQGCDACYIPHPDSCFKFIVCQRMSGGSYYSQVMPCAFGTMWKVGSEPACDIPELAGCLRDPCADPNMISYSHEGGNCRTYWRCENGRSVAACCSLYQKFVASGNNGTCVDDVTCDKPCPLLNDATCRGAGVKSLNFADGNCKTHFDCAQGQPHPVCCKNNEGYDAFQGICVPDPNCNDPCPVEYQGMCSKLNVTSYALLDKNCRTYMKCDGKGGEEPHCCKTGHMYDPGLRQCVSGAFPYECEFANCPRGYKEECAYEAILNNSRQYKNLDSHGGQLMSCAVGTKFDPVACQCAFDPEFFLKAKVVTRVCELAIDVRFPNLQNLGAAAAAILMIGDYGQGEKGVGDMVATWDGQDGVNIPYYGSQELPALFLEIGFTPTAGSALPQILLSSCFYDAVGIPSLEVRLVSSPNNTGNLNLSVGNKFGSSLLQASVPYQFNVPYIFRMIYDGKVMGVFLETADGSLAPVRDVRDFSGLIPIHRSGLRFAHCRYETNVSSFIGTVSTIKFSKCVTDAMKEVLYPAQIP